MSAHSQRRKRPPPAGTQPFPTGRAAGGGKAAAAVPGSPGAGRRKLSRSPSLKSLSKSVLFSQKLASGADGWIRQAEGGEA